MRKYRKAGDYSRQLCEPKKAIKDKSGLVADNKIQTMNFITVGLLVDMLAGVRGRGVWIIFFPDDMFCIRL
ncbi:MAG TPA: hypothetical protein VF141_00170 [Chryseolinea sp.]